MCEWRMVTVRAGQRQKHYVPFSPWPEQVGPQDDGDVTGCHLVYSLMLRQQRQELDQVPDRGKRKKTSSKGRKSKSSIKLVKYYLKGLSSHTVILSQ